MALKIAGSVKPEDTEQLPAVQVRLLRLKDGSTVFALGNQAGMSFEQVINFLEQGIEIARKLQAGGVNPKIHP